MRLGTDLMYSRRFDHRVDGVMVGCAWTGRIGSTATVGVVVDPGHRGKGIGRALLAEALDGVEGPIRCGNPVHDDPAVAPLARSFGFVEEPDRRPSHWRSPILEPSPLEAEILTQAHLDDPAFLAWFTELCAMTTDGDPDVEPASAEENVHIERRRIETGGFTVLVRDPSGELVACATGSAAPWCPWLTSDHTLVDPGHRSRGYGRRAKELQHAVAHARGFERVVTDVRYEKAHMHAILRGLGYTTVPTPAWVRP
jgi:GNAT superfamily N-acetyltransferase